MRQEFETKDFYLSAFLFSMGCELIKQTRHNSVTTFIFAMNSETSEMMDEYYNLKAKVEPMAYGNAIRALKSIIYSATTLNTGTNTNETSLTKRG